jgi:molybdopterin biosynthesis enzyme MoaB
MAEKENNMVKVDNGTADSVFQKMYKFEDSDIDLIVELLEQELEEIENYVYFQERNYERRDHIENLISEFCK